jgi:hypothetical protein
MNKTGSNLDLDFLIPDLLLDLGGLGSISQTFYARNLQRGARKLTGENLKLVWAEFSTIS